MEHSDSLFRYTDMEKQENFISRVLEERELQRRLWGDVHDSRNTLMEWSAILAKYLGRYSEEACDFGVDYHPEIPGPPDYPDTSNLETALVKLAAVALACYEVL